MGLEKYVICLESTKMNKRNANKKFILWPDNKTNKYCNSIQIAHYTNDYLKMKTALIKYCNLVVISWLIVHFFYRSYVLQRLCDLLARKFINISTVLSMSCIYQNERFRDKFDEVDRFMFRNTPHL